MPNHQTGKAIILYKESVVEHKYFQDYLGIDATSPQEFADAIHALMSKIFDSFGLELPPADPTILENGLRNLAKDEPDLALFRASLV